MNTYTVEMVQFKTKDGIDEDSLLSSSEGIMDVLRRQSGYVRRELLKGPDGLWTDIVYWKSLSEAEEAVEKIMKDSSCHKYIQMIDESSMKMMHLQRIQNFE